MPRGQERDQQGRVGEGADGCLEGESRVLSEERDMAARSFIAIVILTSHRRLRLHCRLPISAVRPSPRSTCPAVSSLLISPLSSPRFIALITRPTRAEEPDLALASSRIR